MKNISKYQGIIPAFYACYDDQGAVSPERVEALTKYMIKKGVKGVYVGGSSGECIYQSVAERKLVLEHVMKAAEGKLTVIAHVACNNTADSMELAAHAESLGVDAIAAIPPIYFHLPEHAIAQYWNDISSAAPNTDFVIYNIPQLARVALTMPLFKEGFVVFNGPDEQLVSGLAMGADGGIGGTYAVMPELYLKIKEYVEAGNIAEAQKIQYAADAIIYAMCECHGNLYAVMKEILRIREGLDIGGVRKPLPELIPEDMEQVKKCAAMIDDAIKAYC